LFFCPNQRTAEFIAQTWGFWAPQTSMLASVQGKHYFLSNYRHSFFGHQIWLLFNVTSFQVFLEKEITIFTSKNSRLALRTSIVYHMAIFFDLWNKLPPFFITADNRDIGGSSTTLLVQGFSEFVNFLLNLANHNIKLYAPENEFNLIVRFSRAWYLTLLKNGLVDSMYSMRNLPD